MPSYVFVDEESAYFVTFAVIGRHPIFHEQAYSNIFIEALNFMTQNGALEVFAYCIMPDHVHMIIRSQSHSGPGVLLGRLKSFTSRRIYSSLKSSDDILALKWTRDFEIAALKNPRNKNFQVWEQFNHPQQISSNNMLDQKVNYIHQNPVKAGLADTPWEYRLSSARDYAGMKGLVDKLTIVT